VGSYELDSSVGSEFEARTFDGAFRLKLPGTSNFIEEIRRVWHLESILFRFCKSFRENGL